MPSSPVTGGLLPQYSTDELRGLVRPRQVFALLSYQGTWFPAPPWPLRGLALAGSCVSCRGAEVDLALALAACQPLREGPYGSPQPLSGRWALLTGHPLGRQSALCVRRCGLPVTDWTALATREPCWPPCQSPAPVPAGRCADNENIGCLLESRQASQVRALVNICCLLVLHPEQTPDSVEESWNWFIGAGQRRSAAHRRGKQGRTDTSDSCKGQQYKGCYRAGMERLL